mmetsp:Transcript_43320/g.129920  ORF Transcript_43320/g.129920 Transcript_43320/m.129920 type:complete len:275 (-) Transcript_43320:8-832(-)
MMAASSDFWLATYSAGSAFFSLGSSKKSFSPFLARLDSAALKYESVNMVMSTFGSDTLVHVAMTYACETRLTGTPLSLKGPVTSSRPEGSWPRQMQRLPLKRPARRIRTVPGVMVARSLVGLRTVFTASGLATSSAGYILGALVAAGAGAAFLAWVGNLPPFFFLRPAKPRLFDACHGAKSRSGVRVAMGGWFAAEGSPGRLSWRHNSGQPHVPSTFRAIYTHDDGVELHLQQQPPYTAAPLVGLRPTQGGHALGHVGGRLLRVLGHRCSFPKG